MNTKETPGLITLTEERLREIVVSSFGKGGSEILISKKLDNFDKAAGNYASRIIEALKKEG